MFVFKKFVLVSRSTRPDPALVVLISPTHKTANLFLIHGDLFLAYGAVGVNT